MHIGVRKRVILHDEALRSAIALGRYLYVSGISYNKLTLGPRVAVKQKKTIIVPLGGNMNTLFQSFRRDTRNEIRHTFHDDRFSFVRNDANISGVYALYTAFERAQGRTPFRKSALFDGCKIFSAYYDNTLISSIICYDAFPVLRSRANFSRRLEATDNGMKRIISRATRRIVYEICRFGHDNNYRYFDHGSVNLTDSAKRGIANFKSGFGGEVVDEYTYTYKSKLYDFIFHKRE